MDEARGGRVARGVLFLLMAVCCTGCLLEVPTLETTVEMPGLDPTREAGPSPDGTEAAALPRAYREAEVVEIIDGDTIRVRVDDAVQTVRYIGIDAPERQEALGPAATEANRELVGGRTVALERDVSETDEYGRWLRYVYRLDGLFVNAEMVRRGLARAQAYPPDVSRQDRLDRLEEEARAGDRGLWEGAQATAAPGEPSVRIVSVDKEAEVVALRNVGDRPQDLAGWALVSERGEQVCDLAGILDPGATLEVWARAEDADRGGYNCGFDENVWNNSEPDEAALYDGAGRLVDAFP